MTTLIITYELIIDQFDVDFPKSIFILYFKKEKFEHEIPEKRIKFFQNQIDKMRRMTKNQEVLIGC